LQQQNIHNNSRFTLAFGRRFIYTVGSLFAQ
jgi:hypothetical protein